MKHKRNEGYVIVSSVWGCIAWVSVGVCMLGVSILPLSIFQFDFNIVLTVLYFLGFSFSFYFKTLTKKNFILIRDGFTRVFKHRAPLARRGPSSCGQEGAIFLPTKKISMDFCLWYAILNLKAFCFGAIPDIMIELIVYGSVPYSGPK